LGRWNPWGRLARRKRDLDRVTFDAIRERREHADDTGTDVLSVLLAARDDAGQPMTEEEVRDELMALLFAGHETTASALTWALYCTHQVPDVEEKLRRSWSGSVIGRSRARSPSSRTSRRFVQETPVCTPAWWRS
jgi:cytochrome P450